MYEQNYMNADLDVYLIISILINFVQVAVDLIDSPIMR
jgi:hypothetical protein